MVGGQVSQVLNRETGVFVEVVDAHVQGISRCWRICEIGVDVQLKDQLWWQSFTGYLSRDSQFEDKDIGSCKPADHPGECDHEWGANAQPQGEK